MISNKLLFKYKKRSKFQFFCFAPYRFLHLFTLDKFIIVLEYVSKLHRLIFSLIEIVFVYESQIKSNAL